MIRRMDPAAGAPGPSFIVRRDASAPSRRLLCQEWERYRGVSRKCKPEIRGMSRREIVMWVQMCSTLACLPVQTRRSTN